MKNHLMLAAAAASLLALGTPAFAADQATQYGQGYTQTARGDDYGYGARDRDANNREDIVVGHERYRDNVNLGATGDLQHNGYSYNPGVAEHY